LVPPADVVAAGDILSTVSSPKIDMKRGGSVQRVLDTLTMILDLAGRGRVPRPS
jgi:hypothetical protein